MSPQKSALANVLARPLTAKLSLAHIKSSDLRPPAKFWFDATGWYKLRKDELLAALTAQMADRARAASKTRSLADDEKQVLAIFERYGGALSDSLLACEMQARGLRAKDAPVRSYYERSEDVVTKLGHKLLLLLADGTPHMHDRYHWQYRQSARFCSQCIQRRR
jgi:hypothetical protein